MIKELERVALTADLPRHSLVKDDVGTVVFVYPGGTGFEVEFFSLTGETIAVATVATGEIRPLRQREVAHARSLEFVPA